MRFIIRLMNPDLKKWLKLMFRGIGALVAGILLLGAIALIALYRDYNKRAATYDIARVADVSQRSLVMDKDGEFYSYIHGENRLVIPLTDVSPKFIQCLTA